MLHFAYGSNMSRALMAVRCPGATALGTATLVGWRFVVVRAGYGSIAPQPGGVVHGVLWRLGPRDLAAINAYESLDSGLYVRRQLPVQCGSGRASALVGRRGCRRALCTAWRDGRRRDHPAASASCRTAAWTNLPRCGRSRRIPAGSSAIADGSPPSPRCRVRPRR